MNTVAYIIARCLDYLFLHCLESVMKSPKKHICVVLKRHVSNDRGTKLLLNLTKALQTLFWIVAFNFCFLNNLIGPLAES